MHSHEHNRVPGCKAVGKGYSRWGVHSNPEPDLLHCGGHLQGQAVPVGQGKLQKTLTAASFSHLVHHSHGGETL